MADASPATRSQLIADQVAKATIVRDVWEGTLRIREAGEAYLPKFEREQDHDHQRRVAEAVLDNAVAKSVGGLGGLVFRRDPTLVDVPDEIEEDWANIDLQGREGVMFAHDVFREGWLDGLHAILVDYPVVEEGRFQTRAAELAAGLRPYWVQIPLHDILRVRWQVRDGQPVLTQFAWMSRSLEEVDEFKEEAVQRVHQMDLVEEGEEARVLRRSWRSVTARHDEDSSGWLDRLRGADKQRTRWEIEDEGRVMAIDEIPVVPFYTGHLGFWRASPPLLDLALENILHYQVRSDRQNVLRIASVPVPVIAGGEAEGQSITVGPYEAIQVSENGSATYMEPQGNGLAESRNELEDIEARMASHVLGVLQRDKRAAETAESKRISKAAGDSQLGASARKLGGALIDAMRLHAKWRDLEAFEGQVEVNRDYDTNPMDAQLVNALSQVADRGQLTLETLLGALKRGEVLPEDLDVEEEVRRAVQEAEEGSSMAAMV